MRPALSFVVFLLCACATVSAQPPPPQAPGFSWTGSVTDAALPEISGIAASRAHPGAFWVHNDSFNPPQLFAINAGGAVLARVSVEHASNVDWEDIALYEDGGRSYLAIADTGDNFSLQSYARIYILPEPALDAREAAPVRQIRYTYEDGPRDVESLAVDVPGRRFLLLDKGRQPVGLYELRMDGGAEQVARRIADLGNTWPQKEALVPPAGARYRGAPTAMDLSADGLRLLVLTYTHALLYQRRAGEDWRAAVARPPLAARLPAAQGLEAACFDADGRSARITGEGLPAALYRWDLKPRP